MSRPKPRPFSWTMFEDQLKELCRKLKPVLGRKADSLWLAYLTSETPQAKREVEMLIQLMATRHLDTKVDDESILLPPPSQEDAAGEFFLGNILYGKKTLYPLLSAQGEFYQAHRHIFNYGRRKNECRSKSFARIAQQGHSISSGGLEAAVIARSSR